MVEDATVDRVRGTLVGGGIGDALGYRIEFQSLRMIREGYGPAGITDFLKPAPQEITDDTQMTMFTAEGLLRTAPNDDPIPALRNAYVRWFQTQNSPRPPEQPDGWLAGLEFLYAARSPGNACMSGLMQQSREPHDLVPIGAEGLVNPQSKGCGTVMRSAPFGLIGAGPRESFELACRAAQLTHGHPTGQLAAGAFAAIVDRLVAGVALTDAISVALELLSDYPNNTETREALEQAVTASQAAEPTPENLERLGGGWIAEECLAIAVYSALHAHHTGDLRAALLLSVNHSGDSDSTGAVTGNLLGAAHGHSALPTPWKTSIEGHDVLVQLADDLTHTFHHQGRQPLTDRYPLDLH